MNPFITILGILIFASFVTKFVKTTFKVLFYIAFPIYISFICSISYHIALLLFLIVTFAIKDIFIEIKGLFKLLMKSRYKFKERGIEKLARVLFVLIYSLFLFICYNYMINTLFSSDIFSYTLENLSKLILLVIIAKLSKPILQKI